MAALIALLTAGTATAQNVRPGDERPELPEPRAEVRPPLVLPPLPQADDALSGGLAVRVTRFEITGSSVFDEATLTATVARFAGRTITSEELLAARDALTTLYVDNGYVTSGAVIPDQDIADGVIRLRIVEGRLDDVIVTGTRRFRPRFFESRLARAGSAPVHVDDLEQALQILQRDPWIERLDATLEPGDALGASRLRLVVSEARQQHLRLEGNNEHSPAIGSSGGSAEAWVANLTGFRDVLSGKYEQTEGLMDAEVRMEIPITPWDTRLRLRFRNTETEIVEEPFDDLDIESTTRAYEVSLVHPLYRKGDDEIWLGLIGEHKTTEARVLGVSFCFEPVTPSCDDPTVSALRTSLDWTRRTREDVFSIRSLLSFGIDVLDATTENADVADGRFVAWLGQAQWAHVFPETLLGSQLVMRGDVQLSSDPLLSIEKLAIGGRQSVRGYRENQLVRDNGVVLSGELRVPLWRDALRRPRLELVPFMDYGHGWNEGDEPPENTLWSAGAGLRLTPIDGVLAEVYWGGRLEHITNPHNDLLDDGVNLRLVIDAF